jgi:hypothetical protein
MINARGVVSVGVSDLSTYAGLRDHGCGQRRRGSLPWMIAASTFVLLSTDDYR